MSRSSTALAVDADQWAYGDTLAGVGNIAALLDDWQTERAAREEAIAAFRRAPQDERTRRSLRNAIRYLGALHYNRSDLAAALPLMEQALALTPPDQDDPDLRAAIELARQRVGGSLPLTLRDAIVAWRDGVRDEQGLAVLLNEVCNHVMAAIGAGTAADREALAEDLALLRAARPLPIAGASDFLHVLQLWLRDEPDMAEPAARSAATLPGMLQNALRSMERAISGADDADDADDDAASEEAESAALAGQLATLLEAAPAERRPALSAVLSQIMPIVQAAATALTNAQVTAQERALFAARLDELATEAAAGEQPGSPWLDAAAALRALGVQLRGGTPDPQELAEPFRTLLAPLIEREGETP